jgi:heme/copper-type cytochrome/quinol oxidase subunit 2
MSRLITAMTLLWANLNDPQALRRLLRPAEPERGSVTIENVIWAIAVIIIAGIVIAAITAYVRNASDRLAGMELPG